MVTCSYPAGHSPPPGQVHASVVKVCQTQFSSCTRSTGFMVTWCAGRVLQESCVHLAEVCTYVLRVFETSFCNITDITMCKKQGMFADVVHLVNAHHKDLLWDAHLHLAKVMCLLSVKHCANHCLVHKCCVRMHGDMIHLSRLVARTSFRTFTCTWPRYEHLL